MVVSVRQAVDPGVGIGCKQPVVSAPRALQTASAGSGGGTDDHDFELTLDLEENRDGSVRAVELGCVALAAPDRQFSYSITAGDDSRFVSAPRTARCATSAPARAPNERRSTG